MKSGLSFCGLQVKNNDYYRYFCCLFAPEMLRTRLFALYAFNNEIAKIKEVTTQPMNAFIRFTWWREALDEIYNNKNIRNHEIVKALAQAIKETSLPFALLEKIIDAHETDIEFLQPLDMAQLIKYTDGTASALLHASLYLVGVADELTFKAANAIGTAYALTGIMRRARNKYPPCPRTSAEFTQSRITNLPS